MADVQCRGRLHSDRDRDHPDPGGAQRKTREARRRARGTKGRELSFDVEAGEAGDRIDVVVARRSAVPRPIARAAISEGLVTVNGDAVKPSYRVEPGDRIVGHVEVPESDAPVAEDIPIEVRYSDDRMLVVSKPPGLVTHPAAGHRSGTLVNALLGMGGPLALRDSDRPGIVHRLDKDTSGLLLVARDDDAHAYLSAALKRREVRRRYLALVRGEMPAPTGTIDAPLGRHPAARRKIAVVPEGRRAITHYEVVATTEEISYLDVSLETGRTHQIRVHLAHLKHPVLGDAVYGGKSELSRRLGLSRPFLHAFHLAIPHPDDDRIVAVEDPLPADLAEVLSRAGIEP